MHNVVTQSTIINPSVDAILESLRIVCDPGDVHEVRVPKTKVGTVSGWFDDLTEMAKSIAMLTEGQGKYDGKFGPKSIDPPDSVYLTLNACSRDLLAHANNRVKSADHTTTDTDIVAVKRLPLDFDPWRRAGISSTDEGHEAAIAKAKEVRDYLTGMGFPMPCLGDSGNGAHLLYGLDLPPSDKALVEATIKAIAGRFGVACKHGETPYNDSVINIDTTIGNPARIWTAYGTMKRKGDDLRDRPHRMAKILESPARLEVVPRELLERVVSDCKAAETTTVDLGATPPSDKPTTATKGLDEAGFGEIDTDDLAASSDDWFKAYRGNLKTLDVEKLWKSKGLTIALTDASKGRYKAQCPDHASHSGTDGKGTFLYKLADKWPTFGCTRTGCCFKGSKNPTRDVLAWFGPELVDAACIEHYRHEASSNDGEHDGGKPVIMVTNRQLPDITADAIKAVEAHNDPPKLFHLSSEVVRMRDDKGIAYTEPMSRDAMAGHLARVAVWTKTNHKGEVLNTMPWDKTVDDLLTLPSWKLPVLDGIINAPIFVANGKLLDQPGYDPDSRLWYEPGVGLEDVQVPDNPTPEQVDAARRLIMDDMLGDFPFKTPADKANCLALLLLPGVRQMIKGNTPMHVLEATRQGSGKGLLATLWGLIWLGEQPAAKGEAHSEKEWNEMIGSALMACRPYFFLDNVKYKLKSASLAVALTTGKFQYRMLGQSKIVDLLVNWVWLATANNIKADDDIGRRLVRCRIEPKCERPELRDNFRIGDIEAWAAENRSRLVSACLTLIRAWIVAGKPNGKQTLGSYAKYAHVIGGILDVAGVPGFLGNIKEIGEVNTISGEWAGLVNAWAMTHGENEVTIKELHPLAIEYNVLSSIMGDGTEQSQKVKLGNALNNRAGQVYGQLQITIVKDEHGNPRYARKGGILYRLVPVPDKTTSTTPPPPETASTSTATTAAGMMSETTTTADMGANDSPPAVSVETVTTPEENADMTVEATTELNDLDVAEKWLGITDPMACSFFLAKLEKAPAIMAKLKTGQPLSRGQQFQVKREVDATMGWKRYVETGTA